MEETQEAQQAVRVLQQVPNQGVDQVASFLVQTVVITKEMVSWIVTIRTVLRIRHVVVVRSVAE